MKFAIVLLVAVGFVATAGSTDLTEKLFDTASSVSVDIKDKIVEVLHVQEAINGITDIKNKIVDKVQEVAEDITDTISKVIDTVTDTKNNIVDKELKAREGIMDKNSLFRQKFLLEILLRVHEPLQFEELIELGNSFTFNKTDYTHFNSPMENFYEAYKSGTILAKGEFFGSLVQAHLKQAYGLFSYFYNAKNFQVFKRSASWARMHCNEGMFVYALTLAVSHHDDFDGLILPSIYEIFPQNFLHSKFIHQAENFDYDIWIKHNQSSSVKDDNNQYYNYTKDWKTWQWWKMMGLNEEWYSEDHFILRENMDEYSKTSKYLQMINGTKLFFMPVDYTRDIGSNNKESDLSYFIEDVGLNAFWYYLNVDYAFLLDGKTYGLDKDRRGEYWLYILNKILRRYNMERLSHGYGETPVFSFINTITHGYNPQLVYHNGVGYSYRKNYYEVESYGEYDYHSKLIDFFSRMDEVITKGVYVTYDGKTIDLRKPKSIEYIGSIMQGNVDALDFKYWYMYAHMYLGEVNPNDNKVLPNIFLNFETMMRGPEFYMLHQKMASITYRFESYNKPYTREELLFPGVSIKNIEVSELVTYNDLVDIDVTSLLDDKMAFSDGKFVWDKTLLARQMRLNHKPFEFNFTIESNKLQKVIVRAFLGPKFDQFGRIIPLTKNRKNFYEIDTFIHILNTGINVFNHSSKDIHYTIEDRTSYTEIYKNVVLASEGKVDFSLDIGKPHCGFPDRLLLPRGWNNGMPMQFFFYISPYNVSYEPFTTYDSSYSCGIGSGNRYYDELPFGYPLNREIDDDEFDAPNMYFTDVKIYHKDTFKKYNEQNHEQLGRFDYNYNN